MSETEVITENVKCRNVYYPLSTEGGGEEITIQSERDNCDINLIVRRHAQTGMWTHLNPRQPHYGDFTGAKDLHAAIEQVREATENFAELPAAVRAAANNDPVQFLEMCADEAAFDHLVDEGLPVSDTYESPYREEEPEPPAPATGEVTHTPEND